MPFDEDLVLHDGTTITADISPTSLTKGSGSVCIDLRASRMRGMVASLHVGNDLAEASDTLLVSIEECATVDGTYVEITRFPLLTKGTGMPGTYTRLFRNTERFVRAKIDVTDADSGSDFTVAGVHILLSTSEL